MKNEEIQPNIFQCVGEKKTRKRIIMCKNVKGHDHNNPFQ